MMEWLRGLIRGHRFFCRKSQHFVLGNWYQYVPFGWRKIKFTLQFPIAYVKFMYYTIRYN